jgi:hypothetical protein
MLQQFAPSLGLSPKRHFEDFCEKRMSKIKKDFIFGDLKDIQYPCNFFSA